MRQAEITTDKSFAVREPASSDGRPSPEPADAPAGVAWPEEPGAVADTSLTIPGRGDRPSDCGDYMPLKYCPECGEPHMVEHRCKGRRCPSCEAIWTGERAEAATVRLEAARLAEPDGARRRVVHVVVSPPESFDETVDGYRRGARRANTLAKAHGIRGGAVIPHGYRVKESVKEEYREGVREGRIEKRGVWSWLKERYDGSRWRAAVYYSPHYHVVGLAEDVAASSPEADDGWVVSRIRSLDRVNGAADKPAHEDAYGLFYYLLSHATFDPEGSAHMVRWFGEYAYSNFSPSDELGAGRYDVLERTVAELREEGGAEGEAHECEQGCSEVVLASITEAPRHLQSRAWCEEVGGGAQQRLEAAVDWVYGDARPPPGLAHPPSKADASEALEALVRE
jgi:hypothetical protein